MALDLDLTHGDPLDRLEHRLGFKAGYPPGVGRPIALLLAVAVLPLVVFAAVNGQLGALVRDPLILGRLVLGLPLLQLARPPVAGSIARALKQSTTTGLVAPEDWPRLEAAVGGALRMRDSFLALVVIVILAFGGALYGRTVVTLPFAGSWARAGERISLAGWWYVLVALAVFDLVRLRWLWRLLVWWRFVFGLSRLPLRLVPSHPDRVGGLGVFGNVAPSLALLVFGLTVGYGFDFRARILVGGAKLASLYIPMVGIPVLFLAWMLTPMLFFMPHLFRARNRGKMEYGQLAARYTRRFEDRWLAPGDSPGAELLGSQDIQSLADLANSYAVVDGMRPIPLTLGSVRPLLLAAAVAMIPALEAEIPLKELLLTVLRAMR